MFSTSYSVNQNGNFYGDYDSLYTAVSVAENMPNVSIYRNEWHEPLYSDNLILLSETKVI